jgi:hypothetical protein
VTAIEAEHAVKIPGREFSADVFDTLGSLNQFVSQKVGSSRANGPVDYDSSVGIRRSSVAATRRA